MRTRIVAVVLATAIVALLLVLVLPHLRTTKEGKDNPAPLPEISKAEEKPATVSIERSGLAAVVDKSLQLDDRLKALHKMPRHLSLETRTALRKLVKDRQEDATLRNDALVKLMNTGARSPELGTDLVRMFHDKEESVRWRDYCLQHAPSVYSYAADQAAIREMLLGAARGQHDVPETVSGTAMMSLKSIGQKDPAVAKELKELTFETVHGKKRNDEALVTALQLSRDEKNSKAVPRARRLAADSRAKARVRLSAISLLGNMGEKQDLALLQKLTVDRDDRVQRAARYNRNLLQKKHSPAVAN